MRFPSTTLATLVLTQILLGLAPAHAQSAGPATSQAGDTSLARPSIEWSQARLAEGCRHRCARE